MESPCGFSTHCISWELWFPIPGKKILTLRINERNMVSNSVKNFSLGLHVVSKQKLWVHHFTELWRPEVARRWENRFFAFSLEKTTPLWKHFQNSAPKGFMATPIDVLCSNLVKFGRREIGKIVRCLPDKQKKQNFASLARSLYCADCAHSLPGSSSDNVLIVFHISSKSAHFRRSYTRTREHHQNGP